MRSVTLGKSRCGRGTHWGSFGRSWRLETSRTARPSRKTFDPKDGVTFVGRRPVLTFNLNGISYLALVLIRCHRILSTASEETNRTDWLRKRPRCGRHYLLHPSAGERA